MELHIWVIIYTVNKLMTAICAYSITNDFKHHEALIDFKKLDEAHTGVGMAKALLETLDKFGLAEKLFCITSDAASNNCKMTKELQQLLRDRGIRWNAKEMHLFCLAHVINLAVQDFLKALKVVKPKDDTADDDDDDDDDDEDLIEVNHFESTVRKVRGIAKVLLTIGK